MPESPSLTPDNTDNWLILSRGELVDQNVSGFPAAWPAYNDDVFGKMAWAPTARVGSWGALQALGGPFVSTADGCTWAHAWVGRFGSEGDWNGICSPLGVGAVVRQDYQPDTSWTMEISPDGGIVGDFTGATIRLKSEALWLAAVRPYLETSGVLPAPDPVADGFPADSELVWEGDLKLTNVEITLDADARPAAGTEAEGLTGKLRRFAAPTYAGGDPDLGDLVWDDWPPGNPNDWNGEKSDLTFSWVDGDPTWTEIDGVISGDTGWEGLADPYTEPPDELVSIGLDNAFDGSAPPAGGNSRNACVAVRYTFEAPNYHWVFNSTVIPPRRIFGRSDGLTHGARRVLGGGNTRQAGNRTLGGIL